MALRGGLANNGAGFVLWTCALGLVLFGRAFRDSCFSVVLFVVRAFGFVLLVVLFVVRSFRDSCFWGLVCVFFLCFKILRGVCGKVRGFLMQR